MSCFNKNTKEYIALTEEYGAPFVVDTHISNWQSYNRSKEIPTPQQVEDFLQRRDALFNIKKREFSETIMANLGRIKINKKEGIAHQYNDQWYVNNTDQRTRENSLAILNRNKNLILSYLKLWNIPLSAVKFDRRQTIDPVTSEVIHSEGMQIDFNVFMPRDIIQETSFKNKTNIDIILAHLQDIFPQVRIKKVSIKEAEDYYNSLPKAQRKVPFPLINSYFHNGTAHIIEGRVTTETAIEEVLHPFVASIKEAKPELYRKLIAEAKQNFPQLYMEIKDSYTNRRGFTEADVTEELVTQSLSRHFNKEYEQTPTQSWKSVIRDVLKWLSEYIKDIYKYVSGNTLKLKPSMLNDKATLTDIAKLLNTGDLEFSMSPEVLFRQNIKFSLSKKRQDFVNEIKGQAGTKTQKDTISDLTHDVIKDKKKRDQIAANAGYGESPLVVLDEPTHTYTNVRTGEIQKSTTTRIKGYMSKQVNVKKGDTAQDIVDRYNTDPNNPFTIEKLIEINPGEAADIVNLINQKGNRMKKINVPKTDYQFNIDLGNDFDTLMEGAVLFTPWDEVKSKMTFERIPEEKAFEWYTKLSGYIMGVRRDGTILIPQVIINDPATKTAGAVDILAVRPDGSLQIIDLKTSINSINDNTYNGPGFPIAYGSDFYVTDDSTLDKNGDPIPSAQMKMNTRMQHSLQVGTYRRILQNMGYRVYSLDNSENQSETWHINVEVDTKTDDDGNIISQTFKDAVFEGQNNYSPSENIDKINKLVPLNIDQVAQERNQKRLEDEGIINPAAKDDFLNVDEEIAESEIIAKDTYDAMFNTLADFQQALFTRRNALEQMRDASRLLKSKQEVLRHIDYTISAISIAMRERKVDILFNEIVQQAIDDLNDFQEYIENDKNFSSPSYINKVQSFAKLAETFRGLTELKTFKGLTIEQKDLLNELKEKLKQILGRRTAKHTILEEGLVDKAIENYVRTYVTDNTIRKDLTPEDLQTIMTFANDIGIIDYATGDLATQGDTLLALMDKLFKQKKQEAHDKIEERNRVIRQIAVRLERLSQKDKLGNIDYGFMLIFDKDGNFTGRYVKEIGDKYYNQLNDIRSELFDREGNWIDYIYHANKSDYTAADQDHNIKLFKKRQELRKFMQAEEVVKGKIEDGKYHRYTQEFKDARAKYEIFRPYPNGKGGKWLKRKNVPVAEYQQFQLKYYDSIDYMRAEYDDQGNFTGRVMPATMSVPKTKYKEIRKTSKGGLDNDMVSDKYKKLQNPETELEIAQRDFYEAFVKYFEKDLLVKLPTGVMDQMVGRVPLIKATFLEQLKQGPAITSTLFAKMARNFKNFWQTTSNARKVNVDENGEIIETLPIYYVGSARNEQDLKKIDEDVNAVEEWFKSLSDKEKESPANLKRYNEQKDELIQMRQRLQTQPALNELSLDMADSLLRFSAMAEQYEILGSVEDTMHAFLDIIHRRQYNPAGEGGGLVAKVKGKLQRVGRKVGGLEDPNLVTRVKKWMKMTYYESDRVTKNWMDKSVDALIQYSSLTYVGFNPWGNFNNYMVGRLSNAIELAGGRYLDRDAQIRAEMEFNKRAIPDIIKRIGHKSAVGDLLGLTSQYAEYIPRSKYEAMVNLFRMMDSHADIRESGVAGGKEGIGRRIMSWGYLIQDAAEYNVQTKLGVGILMSWQMKNSKTGETMSVYDAMSFDPKTGETKMKEGYDTLIHYQTGAETKWNDKARYNLRNYIREVNKQTHGNYAQEDRMIIQSYSIGRLIAQFHKWVAPMVKARFRKEYFDENLGHVEGRYLTAWSFLAYGFKNLSKMGKITEGWKAEQGGKADYKMQNLRRNLGDIAVVTFSLLAKMLLTAAQGDDEDDSAIKKRLMNALIYQADRQRREFIMFWFPFGIPDMVEMAKSPMASIRSLEELMSAFYLTFNTFAIGITKDKEEFMMDKRVVFQRGHRAGDLKMKKQWLDAIPLLYAIEKWKKYEIMKKFWIQ